MINNEKPLFLKIKEIYFLTRPGFVFIWRRAQNYGANTGFSWEQAELDSIELEDIINSLSNAGEIYQEKQGSYKKI